NISLESIVQRHRGEPPHGGDVAGSSGQPVPVILITYATTEDAVRKALAAGRRGKGILGKPQGIRLAKNRKNDAASSAGRRRTRRDKKGARQRHEERSRWARAVDQYPTGLGDRTRAYAGDRARDRAGGGRSGTVDGSWERKGRRPGGGERHAPRAQ